MKVWDSITPSKIAYDNYTSRLFYQATFGICLAGTAILGTEFLTGESIYCPKNTEGDSHELAEKECWVQGLTRCNTAVCKESYNCQYDPNLLDLDMNWYRFGALILFFNAVVFRIPHQIWKIYEGGVMKRMYSEDAKAGKESAMDEVLREKTRLFQRMRGNHQSYYAMFVFSQFLNILVVIGIFYFNFVIFKGVNGGFLTYGIDVISYALLGKEGKENMAMCNMFPVLKSSCDPTLGGKGSGTTSDNVACQLNQNAFNQIIYFILWFWYCSLIIVGVFQLMFEAALILRPSLRRSLIEKQLGPAINDDRNIVSKCLNRGNIGDWFLLYQIGKNMEKYYFMEFLRRVANQENNAAMVEAIPLTEQQSNINAVV